MFDHFVHPHELYVGSNHGEVQNPFIVAGAASAPWAFAGTGFVDGSTFGTFGIEVDARLYDVFTLRDGKIVRMDQFTEQSEALEAVGLRSPAR